MYFRNYGVQNTLLNNCPKITVSEDLSTSNMLRVTKHC